jgi:hypothetical protein
LILQIGKFSSEFKLVPGDGKGDVKCVNYKVDVLAIRMYGRSEPVSCQIFPLRRLEGLNYQTKLGGRSHA